MILIRLLGNPQVNCQRFLSSIFCSSPPPPAVSIGCGMSPYHILFLIIRCRPSRLKQQSQIRHAKACIFVRIISASILSVRAWFGNIDKYNLLTSRTSKDQYLDFSFYSRFENIILSQVKVGSRYRWIVIFSRGINPWKAKYSLHNASGVSMHITR